MVCFLACNMGTSRRRTDLRLQTGTSPSIWPASTGKTCLAVQNKCRYSLLKTQQAVLWQRHPSPFFKHLSRRFPTFPRFPCRHTGPNTPVWTRRSFSLLCRRASKRRSWARKNGAGALWHNNRLAHIWAGSICAKKMSTECLLPCLKTFGPIWVGGGWVFGWTMQRLIFPKAFTGTSRGLRYDLKSPMCIEHRNF